MLKKLLSKLDMSFVLKTASLLFFLYGIGVYLHTSRVDIAIYNLLLCLILRQESLAND